MFSDSNVNAFAPISTLNINKKSSRQVRISSTCLSTRSLGVKRINQYVLLKKLGTGATSSVVSCIKPGDDEDENFAMKIIKRSKI